MEKLECYFCHSKEVPLNKPRRRNLKEGRPVFCDRRCSASYRHEHPKPVVGPDSWELAPYRSRYADLMDPNYYAAGGYHNRAIAREWQEVFKNV